MAFMVLFPLGGETARWTPPGWKVAARHGATGRQITPAGLVAASPATAVIPGTLEPLEEDVAAAGIRPTAGDLADLS